jgi:hypothetical protein
VREDARFGDVYVQNKWYCHGVYKKLQTAGGHTSLGVVAPEGLVGGEFLKRESIVKALEAAEDVDVGDGSR